MIIPNKKRNVGLDIARTCAILLVLFSHTLWISDNYPKPIATLMQMSGTIGVEVFFVISGFLIARIILRDITKPNYGFKHLKTFILRRWVRTFPAYYLILLLNVLIWYCIYNTMPKALYKYFIFIQNFCEPSPAFYRISWSLSVEQFSYIIIPLILFVLIAKFKTINRRRLFFYVTLLTVIIFTIPKLHFYLTRELKDISDWNENIRKVLINRLDAVYLGFLFRYLYDYAESWFNRYRRLCFLVGLSIIIILHVFRGFLGLTVADMPFFMILIYLPLNSISVCLLLPYLMKVKISSKRIANFFMTISLLSYSIYLLHYSIILHLLKVFVPSENLLSAELWLYTFLYWGLTFGSAYIFYNFYELPLTKMRDHKRFKAFFNIH
ncbi:acyltransferase [uncultured Winogradskyella sp.]|uniref:acyltransferase family protein n=1 Tax=uncultured Winogradskyella sp. TaxID=395353 RepID=UPI002624AB62|nr:acyltransferase [uncultured Winogradskyella sp.]